MIDTPVRPGILTLPSDPQSPHRARAFTEDYVRAATPDASTDHVDNVVLVVSELVTNSVRYGTEPGDSVRLVLDIDPARTRIRVEVHDPARRAPRPRIESPGSIRRARGRGLGIINTLCHGRWGVDARPLGKYVWAEVASR